jgi:hypothetical protein
LGVLFGRRLSKRGGKGELIVARFSFVFAGNLNFSNTKNTKKTQSSQSFLTTENTEGTESIDTQRNS